MVGKTKISYHLVRAHHLLLVLLSLASILWPPQPAACVSAKDGTLAQQVPSEPPDAGIAQVMRQWLKRPELQHSLVGIEVMELPSGSILYSFNGNRRFVPASTAKLMSTACAFELLGPEWRYSTRFLTDGPIRKDHIDGNLLVKPSQDPTLETSHLQQMIAHLKARGVKRIDGRVVIEPVAGGHDYFAPGWLAEDWGQYWMPASSNLVVDRNLAYTSNTLHKFKVYYEQLRSNWGGLGRTLLTAHLDAGWIYFDPLSWTLHVYRGTEPVISTAERLPLANPSDYHEAAIVSLLANAGIRVGGAREHGETQELQILYQHDSSPLRKILETTLHDSDNLYAQQLLRTLGMRQLQQLGTDNVSLEEAGLMAIREWLHKIGVPASEVVLVDGCGLSRKNCISAHALNMVHKHMQEKTATESFTALMHATSGVKGQKASYRFKTGAMDSVRSVSGVLRTLGGQSFALSILVNGHAPSVRDVRVLMANLVVTLENLPPPDSSLPAGSPVIPPAAAKVKRVVRPAHEASTAPRKRPLQRGARRTRSRH